MTIREFIEDLTTAVVLIATGFITLTLLSFFV